MQVFARLRSQAGFTLLEVMAVILILSVLAGIAVARAGDITDNARQTVVRKTVNDIQRSIQITAATNGAFPVNLDGANGVASTANPFFTNIGYPVTTSWQKNGALTYQTTNLQVNETYAYNPATGLFQLQNYITSVAGSGSTPLNILTSTGGVLDFISNTASPTTATYWYKDAFSMSQGAGGAVFTPWSGHSLDYKIKVTDAGTYNLSFQAMNYATHGQPGRLASEWKLPDGYSNFQFTVKVDGTNKGTVNIAASDTQYNNGNINLTGLTAGEHTVSIVWNNDSYNETAKRDANAMVRNVTLNRGI